MKTSNILVPFEISSTSYKAFRTALDIAKENKAILTVLTVINSSGKAETHGFEHMLPGMVLAEYDQRRVENEWNFRSYINVLALVTIGIPFKL